MCRGGESPTLGEIPRQHRSRSCARWWRVGDRSAPRGSRGSGASRGSEGMALRSGLGVRAERVRAGLVMTTYVAKGALAPRLARC